MVRAFYFFSVLLFSYSGWAFPVGVDLDLDAPLENYVLDRNEEEYDFNGIVAMRNCSAAVVHFQGQPKSSKAYVLTNGHCTGGFFGGFPDPGEVIYKKRDSRTMNAHIDIDTRVGVRAEMLVYGTMTDTDAALFRLTETYEQLEEKGVGSFEIIAQRPEVHTEIQIISGYWRRGFTCEIENFIFELHEADYIMKDSIRYSDPGCEVYGGTSGSPVIEKGTRQVVAVNNTGNESGEECTMNNPCEVSSTGDIQVIEGRGYAQQVYWFHSCLDKDFDIDLSVSGCQLPKP